MDYGATATTPTVMLMEVALQPLGSLKHCDRTWWQDVFYQQYVIVILVQASVVGRFLSTRFSGSGKWG